MLNFLGFFATYYIIPKDIRELRPGCCPAGSPGYYIIPKDIRELRHDELSVNLASHYIIPKDIRELRHRPGAKDLLAIISYQKI